MDRKQYMEIGITDRVADRLGDSVPITTDRGIPEFFADAGAAMAGGFTAGVILTSVRKFFDINSIFGDIGEPLVILIVGYALKRITNDIGQNPRWIDQMCAGMFGAIAGSFGKALVDLIAGKFRGSNGMDMLSQVQPAHYGALADLTVDALRQSGAFNPQNEQEAQATRMALRGALPQAASWYLNQQRQAA